jgi:TDG/mug DNA glycosylase family protein
MAKDVLADVVEHGLDVIFCGSAAGARSARVGAYYANPQNKFWRTLYETGLTSRLLLPQEFVGVREFGLGLTDMAKQVSGSDASLPRNADTPGRVRQLLREYRPAALAFNGKRPGAKFLGVKGSLIKYGRQQEAVEGAAIFILPSTFTAGIGYWNLTPWQELATFVAERRKQA